SGSVLQTCNYLRSHNVPSDSSNEDVADGLVKNDLDRNTGIRASENGRKRLLLLGGVPFQDRKILLMSGGLARNKAFISCQEFLQGGVGRQLRLGNRCARRAQIHAK